MDNRVRWTLILAAALVLPAALFVGANVLKYSLGIDGPYAALGPLTNPPRSTTDYVTALVLLGPVVGLALVLWPILRLGLGHTEGEIQATVTVRLRWANVAVAVVALGVLAVLFGHVMAENAACWFGTRAEC